MVCTLPVTKRRLNQITKFAIMVNGLLWINFQTGIGLVYVYFDEIIREFESL
jgi:hypothetical protein